MNSSLWIRISLRNIAKLISEKGYTISPPTISRILTKHGYSLKSNVKEKEGRSKNPDRDLQFKNIDYRIKSYIRDGFPVISVDTKKKELVGNFKNNGKQWCLLPEEVNVHDFPSDGIGRAIPYGVYELNRNKGFVSLGMTNDTPEFAVDSIQKWWELVGQRFYKNDSLLILADCGGSNGYRSRLFKKYIQEKLCDKYGLTVMVCHYPPGCSKWNPIEHRMFSEISKNWSGKPLRTYEDILNYIRSTHTNTGLEIEAVINTLYYETGKKISDNEYSSLNLSRLEVLCPQWNYALMPRQPIQQTFSFYSEKVLEK